jgi:NDP-4-keto-2,6-dideoxyhexose 3-C-methyltransferase
MDLGSQAFTGIFPRSPAEPVPVGELMLVKCVPSDQTCGLVQLGHNFDPKLLYGQNYGYRSGLNKTMVSHLKSKVNSITDYIQLEHGDVVLDIGSNDGTTLSFFPSFTTRIGIDPTIEKFERFYSSDILRLADFFSAEGFLRTTDHQKARVVTSFAMMYDLEDPISFAIQVASVLSDDGIWVFEQSYMPAMVQKLAFDTICHEHLEYYGLSQIQWILKAADLVVLDVEFNDVNGGSFSVTAGRGRPMSPESERRIQDCLERERLMKCNSVEFVADFALSVQTWRSAAQDLFNNLVSSGMRIGALGASTKGNVLLQYCNLGPDVILSIGDINEDKWGAFTPGTLIPIESETAALQRDYDAYVVLPWHFREHFLSDKRYLGKKLIFPLPALDVV